MGGFGLFFAWMFICFFWLFCEFPPDVALVTRDFSQLFIFLAVPIGYLAIHVRAKNPEFNLFSTPVKVGSTVCAIVQPALAIAIYLGVHIPLPVVCVSMSSHLTHSGAPLMNARTLFVVKHTLSTLPFTPPAVVIWS